MVSPRLTSFPSSSQFGCLCLEYFSRHFLSFVKSSCLLHSSMRWGDIPARLGQCHSVISKLLLKSRRNIWVKLTDRNLRVRRELSWERTWKGERRAPSARLGWGQHSCWDLPSLWGIRHPTVPGTFILAPVALWVSSYPDCLPCSVPCLNVNSNHHDPVAFCLYIHISPLPPSDHVRRALRSVPAVVVCRHKTKASKLLRTPNQLLERECILLISNCPVEEKYQTMRPHPTLCAHGALVAKGVREANYCLISTLSLCLLFDYE